MSNSFFGPWLRRWTSRHGVSTKKAFVLGTSSRLHVEQLEDRNLLSADTLGPLTSNLLVTTPTHVRPTITALISDLTTGHSRVVAAEFFIDTPGANGTGIAMSAADGAFNSASEKVKALVPGANFVDLADGPHTIYVHGKDASGNWGTLQSIAFTKDTIAPEAPTQPTLLPSSDSGFVANDNITNVLTPTVTGSAEDGALVRIYSNNKVVGAAFATGGTYTVTIVKLAAGNYTFTARAADAAGNMSGFSDPLHVTIDNLAPSIAKVTPPPNGTFDTGQNLDFTVSFSEPVVVSGSPALSFVLGSTKVSAVYVSGNQTKNLVFRYTVQSGDTDTNGIVVQSPLVLNGGTIQDTAGNASRLTFTAPKTPKVLVDGKDPSSSTVGPLTVANSANFVKTDAVTQGSWQGVYGADGYRIAGDATSYPAYAQVALAGITDFTWASSTTDPRALQQASGGGRVAATWYSSTSFTVDINLTDGQAHSVAFYMVDWDGPRRSERVDVLDPTTGQVLDSQSLSNFRSGDYFVWNLQGHVTLRFASLQAPNAVLSGLFFGPAIPIAAPAATFVQTDTTTQGYWQGAYGTDGYSVAGDSTSYPKYAQVAVNGASNFTWENPSTDSRALQKVNGGLIAATWYSPTSFTIDINLTDGQSHPVALYFLDWDGPRRDEQVDILDATTGAVLNSQNVSNFVTGEYLVWNLQGHVTIRVTNVQGPNAVVSGLFFGPPAPPSTHVAQLVSADTQTRGAAWQTSYGADGHDIAGDTLSNPSYGQITTSGASFYTWNSSTTTDTRALQRASGPGLVAATWYSATSFNVDVQLDDNQTHQIALYFVDWDGPRRAERVDVINPVTGAVLDSEVVTNFVLGEYLVWNVQGSVRFRITSLQAPNAVLSGIFVGPPAAAASTSATFITTDTQTQGANWQSQYGRDGYSIADDSTSIPSYARVTMTGNTPFVWADPTTDPRGLQRASSSSLVAATWFSPTAMTVDVNFVDQKPHTVSLYFVDWDGPWRSERIDVVNPVTGAVLDSHVLSNFEPGEFLSWSVQGYVRFVITALPGSNAVLSGIFFGPARSSASFNYVDSSTAAFWTDTYGTDGHSLAGSTTNLPSYAQVSLAGTSPITWAGTTTDPRALQQPTGGNLVAAAWYSSSTFTVDVNMTDGLTHTVSLYFVDWDGPRRSERVDVINPANGAVLDSQTVTNFYSGEYLVWNLQGHVQFRITSLQAPNAVLSGIFFGNNPNGQQVFWQNWVDRYVNRDGVPMNQDTAPQFVLEATRMMYLQATTFADPTIGDVSGSLYYLIRANPTMPYWGLCQDSQQLVRSVLQVFGVLTREVIPVRTADDIHDAMEYYSPRFGKWIFADPLFGVQLINQAGVPASVDDILNEISLYGPDSIRWDFQPVKVIDPLANAKDPRLQGNLQKSYNSILDQYLNLIVQRDLDYTNYPNHLSLAANEATGTLVIYDTTALRQPPNPSNSTLLQSMVNIWRHGGWNGPMRLYVLNNETALTGQSIPTADLSGGFPSYVQITNSPWTDFTWANSTTDVRALQGPQGVGRQTATWYSATSFSLNLNFTDNRVHQVSLYLLDWDNGKRSERIDVVDLNTNTVVDSRVVSNFSAGEYLVWNVRGNVRFRITDLSGANAALSAVFFDPTSSTSTATATFVKTDTTTKGNWRGVYGADGYRGAGDISPFPGPNNAAYLQNLATAPPVSPDQTALLAWIDQYVNRGNAPLTPDNIARWILAAQRQMFLNATTSAQDVGGDLYDLVLANPSTPYWSNAADTADFVTRALGAFGVSAREITLWHDQSTSHELVEYFSPTYGKFVLYDPFYGVMLTNSNGTPASIDDVLLAATTSNTFDYTTWGAYSQLARPYDPTPGAVAQDPRYQAFNGASYGDVFSYYLDLVAVQTLDNPGPAGIGTWQVYDNTVIAGLSSSARTALLTAFANLYSVRSGGNYNLTIASTTNV